MKRPVTICTGQFGDLPFEELCRVMHGLGYDGLELAAQAHIDVRRIVSDPAYREAFVATLNDNELIISAISCHLMGQCWAITGTPGWTTSRPPPLGETPMASGHGPWRA